MTDICLFDLMKSIVGGRYYSKISKGKPKESFTHEMFNKLKKEKVV